MTEDLDGKCRPNVTSCDTYHQMENLSKPMCEDEFRQIHRFEQHKDGNNLASRIKTRLACSTETILNFVPVLKWLPRYNVKQDLCSDVIAGVTVAIMHIPQGMAYALLGGVPPIVGIYMAFFPVWVYFIMGTSRHVSMGTFAVICLMVSKCVVQYSTNDPTGHISSQYNVSHTNSSVIELEHEYSPIAVATAVCFVVGIWQVLLGICRLGCLSVLLSEALVSSFTTGAAIHVLTSQVTNLLGLRLKKLSGPLKLIYIYIDIFRHVRSCNSIAIAASVICILVLVFFNEIVKPFLNKKFPKCLVPVPIELIIIVCGTIVSSTLDLTDRFDVVVVGNVPTGLPTPTLPELDLVPKVLFDGLIISVVAISINLSMASIFARKLNYEIDSNQEILASGFGNIFGSFFSCMPYSASLSRSLIQQTVGGKTQVASVVSCVLLLFVLLFIGPFFEELPNCILSSIIVVALKGMLLQFKDFPVYLKYSKLDGLVWVVTFLSVVCLDIDYGLGVGLVTSIASVLIRGQNPEVIELGNVPTSNLFLDINTFKSTINIPNILILKIIGGLHFANCEDVRKKILSSFSNFLQKRPLKISRHDKFDYKNSVVISLSSVSYIDPSMVKVLISIENDLSTYNTRLFLCECSDSVYRTLERCEFFNKFPRDDVFPYLSDVVFYLDNERTC